MPNYLKTYRQLLKVPARDIARHLKVSRAAYYAWETGKKKCPPNRQSQIVDFLNTKYAANAVDAYVFPINELTRKMGARYVTRLLKRLTK